MARYLTILLIVFMSQGCEDTSTLDEAGPTTVDSQTPSVDSSPATDGEAQDEQAVNADAAVSQNDMTSPDVASPDAAPLPPDMAVDNMRVPRVASGRYSMGISLAELGNFEVPFQVELEVVEADGRMTFERFAVRATDGDRVSDPIADLGPVSISPLGTYTIQTGELVMPAAFSPTGSDVRLDLIFDGRIVSEEFICGGIRGNLLTIDTELENSTFGLEPWEGRGPVPPAYCEASQLEPCPRKTPDQCPDMVDGLMEGFVSCGAPRTFEIHLPDDHDPAQSYPILFVFHGLGGSHEGLAMVSGMADLVDVHDFILVVPSSTQLPVEWEQFTLRDNLDLAWFDDTLLCALDQLGADPNRVFVSGMSAGGLYSSYLGLMRSEVIAAAAPMSGGLIINYPPTERKVPYMLSWGGENDFAVEQNFHTFANNLLGKLARGGHFSIACNHGNNHVWDQRVNESVWRFFNDHPLDVEGLPYRDGLPGTFPDFCRIDNVPD